MPRPPRQLVPDICYHVLNRGNDRRKIFHKEQDYLAFVNILTEGLARYDVELFCWCLMPNHWHLVLRPLREKALSEFMRWVTITHVRRYYEHFPDKSGHLYQGRFKAFAVEEDRYFLVLCRYVEANARRAKLIEDASKWQWSSLSQRLTGAKTPPLTPWPVDRPSGWIDLVNHQPSDEELNQIQTSVVRGRPLGSEKWTKKVATAAGLIQTTKPLGRPPKSIQELSPRQRRRRMSLQKIQKA